jgi:hypothetical protein
MLPTRTGEREAASDSGSKEDGCSHAQIRSDSFSSDELQREVQERAESKRREIAFLVFVYFIYVISVCGGKPISKEQGKGPQSKNENEKVDEVDNRKLLVR